MPISQDKIDAARRTLKRKVAAMLIRGMAEEDMGFEQLAEKLPDMTAKQLRAYIHRLIEGEGNDLNPVSDLCLAMDCEPEFSIRRRLPAVPSAEPAKE